MADFKLSHSAQEVDELLGKVKGGVCLPVVEIADPNEITAEENAALTACVGAPMILNMMQEGVGGCIVCNYMNTGSNHMFFGMTPGEMLIIASDDGLSWGLVG